MPKLDPKGEVPNPIKAKLAQEIATPSVRRSSAKSSKKSLSKINELLSSRKKV